MVWAWFAELFAAGACVVLVPVPALDDGADWVWAEFVDGLVCADPEGELEDGIDVEDDGAVEVESCWRCVAEGLELDVLGEDCAKADVAIATAAVVAKNKRLFIDNSKMRTPINPECGSRFYFGKTWQCAIGFFRKPENFCCREMARPLSRRH
ncbi:hypothetical protein [Bradyrhizobium glycinis]|uniref:hypothetical protein n=1 Tax=Bradyrhizobium glycinis TaxID=2751812 RepID=UPI0028A0BC54|nr:hypothetical protein [Bradyrhizobium glycinis]